MEESSNLEYFLKKYLQTKKKKWLDLLIFEYYNNVSRSKEILIRNEMFTALPTQLSYHLLRLLFSTINDLITADKNVLCLRIFLTKSLGGKILLFLSDLDLANVANERELVNVLTKTFPTEIWEDDLSVSRLAKVSRIDVMSAYKAINVRRPFKRKAVNSSSRGFQMSTNLNSAVHESESDDSECEQYESDEFKRYNEQFYLSSAELAMKIIKICCKFVSVESKYLSRYADQNSVTACCLKFALENLTQLNERFIFNESDQSVIKNKLMLLLILCINNLMKCDEKPIDLVFTKISHIIQTNDDIEIACGLIICLLNMLGVICTDKSSRNKFFNQFTQTTCQMVLQQIQNISCDSELLHCLQRHLINNIKAIKSLQQSKVKRRKISSRNKNNINHHHSQMSHCIFERLLINSVVYVKKYKQLLRILTFLRINGICCCNANIDTIKVFLRSTTIPSVFLKFIEKRIFRVVFDESRTKVCIYCSEKSKSESFQLEYISLIKSEISRRNGYELHHLFYHLIIVNKLMPKDFLKTFISTVIVPTFKEEKTKFKKDAENNHESKVVCCFCLQIMSESAAIQAVVKDLMTDEMINHLRDCTIVPVMSINSCIILRHLIDKVDNKDVIQKIKTIIFSNIHSLISELLDIYNKIGLPKIPFNNNEEILPKASTSDASCGFEIVDEHMLLIKANLSNLDILFLSSVHWNILCDLIVKHNSFKADFVANICNNFNEDILFSIAYHAINTILLRRDISTNAKSKAEKNCQNEDRNNHLEVNTRCGYLTSVLVNKYDINYDFIISRSYKLFEICQNFIDKLQSNVCEEDPLCMIYSISRDKNVRFKIASIHRDNFLSESTQKNQCLDIKDHKDNGIYSYQHWFHQFKETIGVFEYKYFQDAITKIVNRFIQPEDELQAIYLLNTIKEITNKLGIKYLSSIAKSCFEICFRLSENTKLCTRMSTAIEELKLLLLQDEWTDNKEALFDALQLLISVAEMKVKSVNQILLANIEPVPQIDPIFHDDSNISNEKIHFSDSDDETSDEDKATEAYFTADENYDADEEYFSVLTDEFECSHSSHQTFSFNTISNFKNTNEHICKLVIEILMNLSRKYIENKNQWDPDLLTSLMKRLSYMNKHFGGSEFLIKGFSPVLTEKGSEYESLQKAVLELLGDLDSPEVLQACFSLLTKNDVPVELIISRMETLCNQEPMPKPFFAVQYPIVHDKDPVLTSTCGKTQTATIESYREIHVTNKLLTPFIEASQIIPLNIFELKLWNSLGYTLSTWIELQEYQNDDATSIHLLSFGTDKLLLAVYVNFDGIFEFNVTKPNQNYGHKKTKLNKLLHDNSADTSKDPDQSNKENINKTNIFGIASAILKDRELPNIRTRGSINKNGLKKSFSRDEDVSRRMETSKVSVRSKKSKLPFDRWTHVCLCVRNTDSQITVLLTLNGIEHESIEIPIDGMVAADVNGKLQLLFVGSQITCNEDFRSTLKYSMNNVMLFKAPLEINMIAYLFGLGPDCDNFIDCELMQFMPLRGYLDLTKLLNKTSLSAGAPDLMYRLQSNVLMTHFLGTSSYATVYVKSEYGKQTGIFNIGKIPKVSNVNSLARSIYFSGGLSTMLFLFARTVELSQDPETQSSALYIFLKNAYSNNYLYAEFEQKNLFNLVAHVFKHGNCYRGPGMLKAILDVIFGGTMFHKKSRNDSYQINERSELNIRNTSLLVKLLTHFNIFQTSDNTEAINLDLFFKSIITTVRDTHPYKVANRQCLHDYGFYEKLIKFCKIHLANTASSMKIASSTALIVVELLKMLSKNPPTMWSLKEIHKLLMLLHHPSESFVTHDRSKFNFILSSQKPSKHNRNQTISSKYFNFSTKIRSSNIANSSPPSPSHSQRSLIGYNSEPPKSPRNLSKTEFLSVFSDSEFSRMSKNATIIPLVRKFKTRKFDELDENQIHKITKVLRTEKTQGELKTPKKVHRKRLQSTPKKNPLKRRSASLNNISMRHIEEDDEIDAKLRETFENLLSSSNLNVSAIDNIRYETGISVLQEQLFVMLKDAIVILDDLRTQTELPECFKIESLIMFANHQDPNVRAAIINLIHILTNRQSTDLVNSYQKSNYWIHLGNQLSIWPANINMVQACIDWICADDQRVLLTELAENDTIDVKYKPAFRVLISILPSMTYDIQLLKYTIKFFSSVVESSHDNFQNLMENGLVVALIKCLMKIADRGNSDCIYRILEQIAVKSFNTMGVMQLIWELLYGLSYAERQNKNEIVREAHIKILTKLLASCLVEQNRRGSRAGDIKSMFTIVKKLGNLPSSEVKTRFNLVHDRSIQYILSWENLDDLKIFQTDFVKYLIDLHFCGIQQGSSLILWSLNPACCEDIKQFTAHKLLANLVVDPNFSMSDGKIFKSLLFQLISTNSTSFSEDQLKILTKYCGTSINQQQQNWNWSMSATEKVENIRQNAIKEQLQQVDKVIYKMELLVQSCIDYAMRMTRDVIDIQNKERRQLMNELKKSQEIDFYHEWYELIQRMTHENAPWYSEELYPTTFELDETEGPARMRIRLKRTILKIEERFFNDEFKFKAHYQNRKQLLEYLLYPKETERYSIRDQIIFTLNAKHLTMEQEIDGEIIVTDTQIIFLTNHNTYNNSIISNITDIDEIWERRYQHKEVALEVFLKSNKSFFIIFESNYDRDIVNKFMSEKIERKENNNKAETLTQKWTEYKLSNYEYLMELNKISGRNYNDIAQYPIFPWILVSFEGDNLDLTNPEAFRKLHKTISTQFDGTEEQYKSYYNDLMSQMNDQQTFMKPYHYSSLYSNSGTVLHFLVRLPPFTNMFLLYQDHNFDIPDRTFHSLSTTFRLTSRESSTDVKELIPEFFFLPDFLENQEGFNYGKRQSGDPVNDVKLPEWCESARTFVLIHRQALESDIVRRNLHHWIDLIFGFKQKGKAAVEAVNVFHYATYPEFQISSITDVVERSACETMVRTYGQMPKQIFMSPHKRSSISSEKVSEIRQVLRNVRGLKWGMYTGSPQLPKPRRLNAKAPILCKQKNSTIIPARDMNIFFVVPNSCSIIQGSMPNTFDLALWKEKDGVVRTKSLGEKKSKKLFSLPFCDPVTCCGTHINYSHIWFGHKSGNISVYVRVEQEQLKKVEKSSKASNTTLEDILDIRVGSSASNSINNSSFEISSKWMYPIILLRHEGEVLDIKICMEFKIAVSIGTDGRAVIWDTQKIEYIRTIEASCNTLRSQLTHVDISTTLGDILTVFKPKEDVYEDIDTDCFEITENNGDDFINISMSIVGKSQLRLNNINGKYIKHIFQDGIVTATCFSFIKEGTGVNVIAAAFTDGSIRMFSTWNLDVVREIDTACDSIIKEISFSTNHYLIILTDQEIHLWGSDGMSSERPNFHDIVFVT